MKKLLLIFLVISIYANQAYAQQTKPVELTTHISEATVYLQGAQINRHGSSIIPSGESNIIMKGLSPYIQPKSIQVKGEGKFTILGVNHQTNYLNKLQTDEEQEQLKQEIKQLEEQITLLNARLSVLNEKRIILNDNKHIGTGNSGVKLEELKQAVRYYEQEHEAILKEEIMLKAKRDLLTQQKQEFIQQQNTLSKVKGKATGEIVVSVRAEQTTTAQFNISYLVANAGWFPTYDIRVKNIESPLNLQYKALVYQNTGVDWDQVKLHFSNGNPNQSGTAPTLSPWFIDYRQYDYYQRPPVPRSLNQYNSGTNSVSGQVIDQETGEAIPGVNVLVKNSSVGTVTNLDGYYSLSLPQNASSLVFSFIGMESQEIPIEGNVQQVYMKTDVQQLSEVVVTGYGTQGLKGKLNGLISGLKREKEADEYIPMAVNTIENQTTVTFSVAKPYSLASGNKSISVELVNHEIEALYEYYAAPKLVQDAFLMAHMSDWDQYNLLEGEANLYFEGAFVGRTVLNAKSLEDTLSVSLGRDKSILIGRNKVKNYSKRNILGVNKVESREFELVVRNKKSQAITIHLYDQIPVSVREEISITALKTSKAIHNEKTGELHWELQIPASTQKELSMAYEVTYPKRETLALE